MQYSHSEHLKSILQSLDASADTQTANSFRNKLASHGQDLPNSLAHCKDVVDIYEWSA